MTESLASLVLSYYSNLGLSNAKYFILDSVHDLRLIICPTPVWTTSLLHRSGNNFGAWLRWHHFSQLNDSCGYADEFSSSDLVAVRHLRTGP